MGYVRLRIRELAEQRGWTFKEVADRSGVNYNTVKSYGRRDALNAVDLSAVYKIARAFEVTMKIWSRFWKIEGSQMGRAG